MSDTPIQGNYTCGENIAAHLAVALVDGAIWKASKTDADHAGYVIGITAASGTEGNPAPVITSGPATYGSWNWVVGETVYLNTSGTLTQTPPVAGSSDHTTVIGVATSATVISVKVSTQAVAASTVDHTSRVMLGFAAPVTFISNLANDANGTAIAAKVNSLRDALVNAGIMEGD